MRHGEALLGAQHNILVAMEVRASSILSWSVPTIMALGAVALHGLTCSRRGRSSGMPIFGSYCLRSSSVAPSMGPYRV